MEENKHSQFLDLRQEAEKAFKKAKDFLGTFDEKNNSVPKTLNDLLVPEKLQELWDNHPTEKEIQDAKQKIVGEINNNNKWYEKLKNKENFKNAIFAIHSALLLRRQIGAARNLQTAQQLSGQASKIIDDGNIKDTYTTAEERQTAGQEAAKTIRQTFRIEFSV